VEHLVTGTTCLSVYEQDRRTIDIKIVILPTTA
jgi:hypothetical protein